MRAALLALLAACGGPAPGDVLRPLGPPGVDTPAGWPAKVQTAADAWADALAPGCPRYYVDLDGTAQDTYPVRVFNSASWPHGDHVTGEWMPGTGIDVLDGAAVHTRLLHELGHGIGLDHSPDVNSVMYLVSFYQTITPTDIRNAEAALGCAP
jgi:hypothetical protein